MFSEKIISDILRILNSYMTEVASLSTQTEIVKQSLCT